jgi:hypothetical protein
MEADGGAAVKSASGFPAGPAADRLVGWRSAQPCGTTRLNEGTREEALRDIGERSPREMCR